MSKEIFISSTPHETRLAIVEDDALTEIYYERENEYTLAGSIYNGKVTRVLPGMQSSFVDVGLERDAFLYITDFMEEAGDAADFDSLASGDSPRAQRQGRGEGRRGRTEERSPERSGEGSEARTLEGGSEPLAERGADRNGRGDRGRRDGRGSDRNRGDRVEAPRIEGSTTEAGIQPPATENADQGEGEVGADGRRRWQGRRGRRRGRGNRPEDGQGTEPTSVEGAEGERPSTASGIPGGDRQSSGGDRHNRNETVRQSFASKSHRQPLAAEDSYGDSSEESSAGGTPAAFVLPGESLSKYRGGSDAGSEAAQGRAAGTPSSFSAKPSTEVEPLLGWDGGSTLPGETLSRRSTEERGGNRRSESRRPERDRAPRPVVEHEDRPRAASVPETQPEADASASHRVDPNPPSEFRWPMSSKDTKQEPAVPEHDVTKIQQTGEMISSPPAVHPEEEPGSHDFAPGAGELEEEMIEEEETDGVAMHAGAEDAEADDLEEETLEGAADLGTMLREMSIDHITRPVGEEDEESDETFAGEDEDAEFESFDSTQEDGEDTAAEAEGETAGEGQEAGAASPERRGRRDSQRRGGERRGGSRDRRPGGRSGGRGRSMQTTSLPAISELLKPGQEILVQIAKEPIAKKGARITSHIALPGRFLVFMPTVNHTGVSRKISSDTERQRLKHILLSEKGEANGGFIVRTAADGASEEELRSDLRFLLNLWTDIKQRSESSKSPALIYHDLNLVERILRDQVTDNFSAIWVDTESEYERVLRFLQRFQPSLIRRVKLYTKETPLFEQFGITEEINKALRSKVWLKSGGSIVINQTEALVAIDINTGKYVGKTARLEDTIVKTNLDAIPEIVRQIRLRDLGGIIIIDFIDMDERKNRHRVMAALEDELKSDRAPSKVLQFNDFGLVAITRKRVKQSLERTLSTTCNVCVGTGMVKSPITVCNDIYVEMRKMHKHLERGDIMLRVHPEVVKQLKSNGARWLQEMEEMAGKTILVKSDPSLHPEQFDIH